MRFVRGLRPLCCVCVSALFVLPMLAQTTYTGKLDGRLHVDPELLSPTVFDAITLEAAKGMAVAVAAEDKVYSGFLALPKNGALRYNAVIVRSPDGADVIYVDANRAGRFEPQESVPFHAIASGDTRFFKDAATFDVALPAGPYATCPMEVRLPKDGVAMPGVGPTQLAVGYTPAAFVQGEVKLPARRLEVQFQFNLTTGGIDLEHAIERFDLNGDGRFDSTPGSAEFVRARDSAPVFRVGDLALQMQSIQLKENEFVVRAVDPSLDQRFSLAVGSVLPDFVFTDFSGVQRRFYDVKGRYILLDFWATWCVPCVLDLPIQRRAYEQFHQQGFEILGMDGDETQEKAEQLLKKNRADWMQAKFDKHLVGDEFQISMWPTMILVDEHHRIVSMGEPQHLPLNGENLAKSLRTLLP